MNKRKAGAKRSALHNRPAAAPAPRAKKRAAKQATGRAEQAPALRRGNRRARTHGRIASSRTWRARLHDGIENGRERVVEVWSRLRGVALVTLNLLVFVAVGTGAVAAGRLLKEHLRTSRSFATRVIEVKGHTRLQRDEIVQQAGLVKGKNVFEVAPETAAARLESHAWIDEAQVERRLPDTYVLRVREHAAVALVAAQELYLVGADGTVFKQRDEGDPADLPVITGMDAPRFGRDAAYEAKVLQQALALLQKYSHTIDDAELKLAEVHVEPDDSFSAFIGPRAVHVRFGYPPFQPALRRLQRVLQKLQDDRVEPLYVYLDQAPTKGRATVRLR